MPLQMVNWQPLGLKEWMEFTSSHFLDRILQISVYMRKQILFNCFLLKKAGQRQKGLHIVLLSGYACGVE